MLWKKNLPNFVKLSIFDVRQGSEYALGPEFFQDSEYGKVLNMGVIQRLTNPGYLLTEF